MKRWCSSVSFVAASSASRSTCQPSSQGPSEGGAKLRNGSWRSDCRPDICSPGAERTRCRVGPWVQDRSLGSRKGLGITRSAACAENLGAPLVLA
eukprot:3781250-Rhodomonas_salina.1